MLWVSLKRFWYLCDYSIDVVAVEAEGYMVEEGEGGGCLPSSDRCWGFWSWEGCSVLKLTALRLASRWGFAVWQQNSCLWAERSLLTPRMAGQSLPWKNTAFNDASLNACSKVCNVHFYSYFNLKRSQNTWYCYWWYDLADSLVVAGHCCHLGSCYCTTSGWVSGTPYLKPPPR